MPHAPAPSRAAALLLLVLLGPGSAALAESADATEDTVVERLSDGSYIDWSAWRLHVHTSSEAAVGAWQDRRLQEQDALDRLRPQVEALARQVHLTPETTAGDLMGSEDELSRRLQDSLRRWSVDETTYHSAGGVEMEASLDLREWLRPALVSLALPEPPPLPSEGATGLVLDARGLSLEASLAPTVVGPDGTVFVRAQLVAQDTARLSSPVIYVRDPADARAVRRAGSRPLFARAAQSRGGELVLDGESARALSQEANTAALVAHGRVVLVVSP